MLKPCKTRKPNYVVTPIHAIALSDGTLIETVCSPRDPAVHRLLIFRDGQTKVVDQYADNGRLFVPRMDRVHLARNLRLATGACSCGSPRQLIAQVTETVGVYIDLPYSDRRLIAMFVLASWISERLPVAPYLWIVGTLGSGKTTLLKLLHALCRRAFRLGDLTPAALYQLPELLEPTLLIDEHDLGSSEMSREIQKLLRIGNTRGNPAIRNRQLYDCYCVKVLSSREPPPDAALASRALLLAMSPSSRQMPLLDDQALDKISAEFQPHLLWFRLHNFFRSAVSEVPSVQDLTPRMRDLARALAVPFLGDVDLGAELVSLLSEQDSKIRINRMLEPEWLVAAAVFYYCHWSSLYDRLPAPKNRVTAGDVAAKANAILQEYGESFSLTPKRVGSLLSALRFEKKPLGSRGIGIELTMATRAHCHRVAKEFGIDRRSISPFGGPEPQCAGPFCDLCEKYQLTAGMTFYKPTRRRRRKYRPLFEDEDHKSEEPQAATEAEESKEQRDPLT
jgi:hypothetical protein